jgi:hypothetical protein
VLKGQKLHERISRGHVQCTVYVAIEIASLGETLKESQSLEEDKSWIKPGRIDCKNLKVIKNVIEVASKQ